MRHVRETVRFADGVAAARADGVTLFVEIGPDAVLTGAARDTLGDPAVAVLPSLRRGQPEDGTFATLLARLHGRGVDVDWAAYFAGRGGRTVALPTYPFQRQRYWLDAGDPAGSPVYRVSWTPIAAGPAPADCLLVTAPGTESVDAVAAALSAQGVVVRRAETVAAGLSGGVPEVVLALPTGPADALTVLQELAAADVRTRLWLRHPRCRAGRRAG